ncbi:MAG: prolipoprotein diacylglyceryl transferase, partial [Sphingomonadales bacterium]|nr:prolipoprotein diacylglyceryl transferase [Sphingomonadales bacterium]
MIPYPEIDPVIFSLGPLKIRWYGLMYVLGFMAVHFLVLHQVKKYRLKFLENHVENLNFALIIGLIIGARFGYMVFYNFSYYLQHPAEILAIWQGGMSFHGGFLGVMLGAVWFTRLRKISFWAFVDLAAMVAPIGLFFGRIANFINAELWGRITDVPWGVIFPGGGPYPRHPSQLYEAALEGLVLGLVMYAVWRRESLRAKPGVLSGTFLAGYGLSRVVVEVFRQPDAHLGLLAGGTTMGQWLSVPMVLGGAALIVYARKRP